MDSKHNGAVSVFCVKVGGKYPADYANRLHRMVRRNLSVQHTFHCVTDDPSGLEDGIQIHEPELADPGTCWNKLLLFASDLTEPGATILYLDLDVVVTGALDGLLHHRPEETFLGQPDWNRPFFPQFNSSVMRIRAGSHPEVVEEFRQKLSSGQLVRRDEWDATTRDRGKVVYRAGWRRFGGDQEWITSRLRPKKNVHARAFPRGWVVSYKAHARKTLPPGAKIVVFHGSPKPHEVGNDYVRENWH